MSVRKRTWTNGDGSQGEAWIVAYRDHAGARRFKSFDKKRDADAYHKEVWVDVRRGIHTADSTSITVAEAGRQWVEGSINAGLERATVDGYRQHLKFHIVPLIGAAKLSQLTVPAVRLFEDRLARDRSSAMVRKIVRSLGSILADAQERGLVAQNVVIASAATAGRIAPPASTGASAASSRSASTSPPPTRSAPSSPTSTATAAGRCC